jgi:enoyl-CoA hydratase/carnithine racemase
VADLAALELGEISGGCVGEKTRGWKTILVERAEDGVATVTLNRPESLNAFNQQMREEFSAVWAELNADDDVRAVVIQAAEGRAFSTGVDVKQGLVHPDNIWAKRDPGEMLGPKSNKVWKPVICAVHGMAAGGAFYWITESDIVICSEDATFFDPHVSYGMVASVEPIGLSYRVGPSQALRMALMGLDERVTARTALQIGLVTEVVPLADLRAGTRDRRDNRGEADFRRAGNGSCDLGVAGSRAFCGPGAGGWVYG